MKSRFWLWAFIIIFASFAIITFNSLKINKEAERIAEIQMANDIAEASVEFTKWINAKIVYDTLKVVLFRVS